MVPLFSPPHQPLDMYVFDAAQRGAGGGYVTRCIKRAGRPRDVKTTRSGILSVMWTMCFGLRAVGIPLSDCEVIEAALWTYVIVY